jgi:hypothetical protein
MDITSSGVFITNPDAPWRLTGVARMSHVLSMLGQWVQDVLDTWRVSRASIFLLKSPLLYELAPFDLRPPSSLLHPCSFVRDLRGHSYTFVLPSFVACLRSAVLITMGEARLKYCHCMKPGEVSTPTIRLPTEGIEGLTSPAYNQSDAGSFYASSPSDLRSDRSDAVAHINPLTPSTPNTLSTRTTSERGGVLDYSGGISFSKNQLNTSQVQLGTYQRAPSIQPEYNLQQFYQSASIVEDDPSRLTSFVFNDTGVASTSQSVETQGLWSHITVQATSPEEENLAAEETDTTPWNPLRAWPSETSANPSLLECCKYCPDTIYRHQS